MKILLLGCNGQLGWELQRALAPLGPLTALDYQELDLQDFDAVRRTVRELRPQVIVNAAAYTDVDKAESEPGRAFAINAGVPGLLAEESARLDALLVHYSTDYVFDGTKGAPYSEDDAPNPLNVYGRSKLAGENAVLTTGASSLILRTAWVYSLRQGGFVNKVLEWARRDSPLRIVSDQVSNPTWARMLAEITSLALARDPRAHAGLYHLAGDGYASRFEWAKLVLELDPAREHHRGHELSPTLTSEFPAPAARPLFSALDCARFARNFGLALPPWQHSLRLAMG